MDWTQFLTANILPLLIGAAIALLVTRSFYSEYIHPDNHDTLLDENTRLLSAKITDLETIKDRIEAVSEAQAKRIEDQEERLLTFTEIEGKLNLYRDSLRVVRQFNLSGFIADTSTTALPDTTITMSEQYTSGLFEVTCSVTFSRTGCVSIQADLQQLRPTRMTYTTTEYRPGLFNTYIYLEDFDQEETLQLSYQPPPEVAGKTIWQEYIRPAIAYTGLFLILREVYIWAAQ